MRQEKIILSLVMVVLLLSMILLTGVGYAAETGNILKISDNPVLVAEQADFKILFSGDPIYIGDGIAVLEIIGPTSATMNITGLKTVGDYVTAIFTIENQSNNIDAEIKTKVTNTNTEFFDVSTSVSEDIINHKYGKAIITITVELIKLPIENDETAYISTDVIAIPIYN